MRTKKHTVGRKKTHAKTHRAKTLTPVQIARAKWRLAVLKTKEINKNWKNKLAEKTVEFKRKLDELTQKAYQSAVESVSNETRRKVEAKAKALAAAEAKFEKKFAKLLARNTKRRGKTKRHTNISHVQTATTHTASTNKHVGKTRGRKSAKHHVTNTAVINHQTTSKKRGRKPTAKSTLRVNSHRMTTAGKTKHSGRPAKHRALGTASRKTHRRVISR